MPQSLILPAVMGGISAIGGALGNRGSTSTSSSTPTYSTDQMGLQHAAYDKLINGLQNPQRVFDPMKAAAMGGVNRSYDTMAQRLQAQYSGRGFGRSGQVLTNARANEISRTGEMDSLETKFGAMQLDYEKSMLDDSMKFGFTNPGNQGTQTNPGNMLGGAFNSGAQTFTSLYMLDKLMKQPQGGNI